MIHPSENEMEKAERLTGERKKEEHGREKKGRHGRELSKQARTIDTHTHTIRLIIRDARDAPHDIYNNFRACLTRHT
jgi:hypothetical protein